MSAVSSSTICHCTNFNNLKSILLSKSFWCSFCKPEELEYLDWHKVFHNINLDLRPQSFPMICFTDLAEEIRTSHKNNYGGCLIELSEKWRDASNLQPVWYLRGTTKNDGSDNRLCSSYLPNTLLFAYKFTEILKVAEIQNAEGYKNFICYLLCYLKLFESTDGYKYYDEREWRYVPFVPDKGSFSLSQEQYNNEHYRSIAIEKIRRSETGKLYFEWDDIISIELQDDSQRKELINILLEKFKDLDELSIKQKIHIK